MKQSRRSVFRIGSKRRFSFVEVAECVRTSSACVTDNVRFRIKEQEQPVSTLLPGVKKEKKKSTQQCERSLMHCYCAFQERSGKGKIELCSKMKVRILMTSGKKVMLFRVWINDVR